MIPCVIAETIYCKRVATNKSESWYGMTLSKVSGTFLPVPVPVTFNRRPPAEWHGPALPQWFAMLPSHEPTLTSGACQAHPHRIAQWARALNALWRSLIREAQDSAGVSAADEPPLRADAEADSELDDDCLAHATQARTSLIALPHRFVVPGGAE